MMIFEHSFLTIFLCLLATYC